MGLLSGELANVDAFRAGVPDGIKDVCDRRGGCLPRDPGRRTLTGHVEGAIARVRVSAVLHPTVMVIALPDMAPGTPAAPRSPSRAASGSRRLRRSSVINILKLS